MRSVSSVLFLLCFSAIAQAQQLMEFADKNGFSAQTFPRVGIEVEMSGLTTLEIANTMQKKLGGVIEIRSNEYGHPEYYLQKSAIGRVVIKPEDNSSSSKVDIESNYEKSRITEIVTDPIHYPEVEKLQVAMDEIKKLGAKGTADGLAVSIQVNVEVNKGQSATMNPREILDLIRNYLNPENRADIAKTFNVPEFRQKYLGLYSEGFMAKVNSGTYNPSWRTFYDDFMYRQTAETMGNKEAWNLPIETVRREVMSALKTSGFEAILPVAKWNFIRLSSLMMYQFPKDPLSKFLTETTWFKGYPLVEFREPNNDFKVLKTVRQTVGLTQISKYHGVIRASHPEDYKNYLQGRMMRCDVVFSVN